MRLDESKDILSLEKIKDEYSEAIDIFPALHKYKSDHNIANLKKLCIELSEFCNSVFASTRSEDERQIYFGMLNKLNGVKKLSNML